jgi:hypothetical protein
MFGKKKNLDLEPAPSLTREFMRIDAAGVSGLQQMARIADERRLENRSGQAPSSDALWQEVISPRPLLLGRYLSFTSPDEA